MSEAVRAAAVGNVGAAGERKVVMAAAVGATLEWYDFFVFASLASSFAKNFFGALDANVAFVFSLLTFAAGFIVRPIGALVFGRLGDLSGRKRTFLLTILVMGVSTVLIGFLPTYAQIGIAAPIALVTLRILQGFALGGEYGAAATYVAEHAPRGKRGSYTSWIQTTSTLGLFLSLIVVSVVRAVAGPDFDAWGWRIPFLVSAVLLAVSVYIRASIDESPAFNRLKAERRTSPAPLSEAFGQWRYGKLVLQALFGLLAGQAVVWFTALFYSLFFLTETLKVDPTTANLLVGAALAISTPLYVAFGRLSDRVGRKPVILGGAAIAAATLFPIFHGLAQSANPALLEARAAAPVVLSADPAECSFQFNPLGAPTHASSCDLARRALAATGASYTQEAADPAGSATIRIGDHVMDIPHTGDGTLTPKAVEAALKASVQAALGQAGYPSHADPARMHKGVIVLLLTVLMTYGAMTLGPISAALVEMFPTRIRYSAMSLPYHVGNGYFGGLLPAICFALVVHTGDIYAGLWYPTCVAAIGAMIGLLFIKEGKDADIYADD